MVSFADRLDAEMQAASISLDSKLDKAAAKLENENVPLDEKLARTDKFNSEIKAFKKDIAEKRQEASGKWEKFEIEFDAGFNKITGAFKNLFS